jgi:hypothetical protein
VCTVYLLTIIAEKYVTEKNSHARKRLFLPGFIEVSVRKLNLLQNGHEDEQFFRRRRHYFGWILNYYIILSYYCKQHTAKKQLSALTLNILLYYNIMRNTYYNIIYIYIYDEPYITYIYVLIPTISNCHTDFSCAVFYTKIYGRKNYYQ